MPIAKYRHISSKDPLIIIVLSVVIASVFTVYPLSYEISGWRPLVMFMLSLFWVLCQPTWCGIWFAFMVGLFTDLLTGTPLGMNALSFVTMTFLVRYLTRERRFLTFLNLWIIVILALLGHLLFLLIAQAMSGGFVSIARHWQPLLSSILFWPILYYGLRRWRI